MSKLMRFGHECKHMLMTVRVTTEELVGKMSKAERRIMIAHLFLPHTNKVSLLDPQIAGWSIWYSPEECLWHIEAIYRLTVPKSAVASDG